MWFFDFARITGAIPVLLTYRSKKLYPNNNKSKDLFKGRLIFCSNHKSYLDPVILSGALWRRRVAFLATKDIFSNKFLNWMFEHMKVIKVDRDDVSLDSFKQAKTVIDRGHAVAIFPESHVYHDDNIRSFKSGAAMLAAICDADILPIYLPPRKKKINRQIVVIGKRINYKQYTNGNYPNVNQIQQITNIVEQEEKKLKEYYDTWYKQKQERRHGKLKTNIQK